MNRRPAESVYDAVIVGAGAAGLSAAAVLGRCRRRVVVVGAGDRANSAAGAVHNLPGAEGVSPGELYAGMERTAARYGVPVVCDTVDRIGADPNGEHLLVQTPSEQYLAARVVLATGLEYVVPPWVPDGTWGSRVFTCPFCHAYEHDAAAFVVLGKGARAVEAALMCRPHAASLTVLVTDAEAAAGPAADLLRELGGTLSVGTVAAATVEQSGELDLLTSDGRRLGAGAVLLASHMRLRSALPSSLGLDTNDIGLVETDAEGRSSHPRVWVVGNAAHPHHMLAESMGSGARAAVSIHRELSLSGLS